MRFYYFLMKITMLRMIAFPLIIVFKNLDYCVFFLLFPGPMLNLRWHIPRSLSISDCWKPSYGLAKDHGHVCQHERNLHYE